MQAVIKNGHYLFEKDGMDFHVPVEIHVSRFGVNNRKGGPVLFDKPDAYKVYINTTEPVSSQNREEIPHVIENANKYHLILTSYQEILNSVPNAKFFPYGTTWLNKDSGKIDHRDALGEYSEDLEQLHKDKEFSVSFLGTNHRPGPDGYKMRHELWPREEEISIPKLFYSSTRNPLPLPPGPMGASKLLPEDDKKHLFKSQFSIAIESTSVENYFSEKLIDCLITKTIPIYWGCPNIEEFFDTRGMIIVNSVDDLIKKVNKLTPETYKKKKKYVEENFELAKEYARSFTDRVKEQIFAELPTQVDIEDDEVVEKYSLSVGIVSIRERTEKLQRLIGHMKQHTSQEVMEKVEVLINVDDGAKPVGEKRNEILYKARGKFICFVDDDDLVSDSYLTRIVELIDNNPDLDCIGFTGMFYNNDKPQMKFKHANMYRGNYKDSEGIQYRPANHLNPIRTELAKQVGFPNKNFGEDADYSDKILKSGLIKKEVIIENEVMYHYLFSKSESKTH